MHCENCGKLQKQSGSKDFEKLGNDLQSARRNIEKLSNYLKRRVPEARKPILKLGQSSKKISEAEQLLHSANWDMAEFEG